jgi:hypothetical protein
VITQLSPPVEFSDTSRIRMPLVVPSLAEAVLVLGVEMTGGRTLALRVSDNLAMPRWREANRDGRTVLLYRAPSKHPGVTEILIQTPNQLKITGRAVAVETAGLNIGAAVQLLSDMLLETRCAPPKQLPAEQETDHADDLRASQPRLMGEVST